VDLVGRPTNFIYRALAFIIVNPRLHIKNRLETGSDLLKLCSLTILLALFSVAIANVNTALDIRSMVNWFFVAIGFELYFLIIFVLPPATGLMALGYLASRKGSEKRIENAAYGYVAGFLSGLALILLVAGSFAPAGLIGIALVGFSFGIALTFVSVEPKMAKSRQQITIAIASAATISAVLLILNLGGPVGVPVEAPPKVSFESLRDQYQVGEEISFSVRLDGFWNDCGMFPQTEVLKSRDGGNSYDELIWLERGTVNDYSDPDCDQNADNISKTRQIKGNPFRPLVLSEGLYEVRSGGDDIQGHRHEFVVNLATANQ
jgi:hypothetical protein